MTAQRANEIELLRASLAGSSEAFEAIVKKYQSLVCAITYSATADLDKSEDLAQQTFVNAWKNLTQLKDLNKFGTWLCSIARSIIRNYFRSQKRDIISCAVPIEEVAGAGQDGFEPVDVAIDKEQQAVIRRALCQIPETYREPLVLYYREHKSLKQVAEELELSEAAARQRISRGRGMLKEQVAAMIETTIARTGPTTAFTAAVGASIAALALETAAAASGAAAATAATTTASGAAASAAASGISAKLIAAAAVMTIAAGAVVTYKQLTREGQKPESADAPLTISQQDTRIRTAQIDERQAIARKDMTSEEISATALEPKSPETAIDTSPPPPQSPQKKPKEFVFKPIGVLSGLITDANTHQPVEGVEVRVSNRSEHHSANSDANGFYFFAAIGSDGPFEIILEAKEHITTEEWKRPRQFVQLLRNRQIVKHFELVKGCKLNITAVDEQENPVRNVGFVAAYTADDMGRGPKRMVFTGKRGNVVLGGLKPAEYLIIAFHKDYALAGQKVALTGLGQVESLEFLMQEGVDIDGSAVCLDGLPASGWRIGAEPRWFHCVRHKIDEKISDEGLFTLPHIVPGLHTVSISIPWDGGSTGLWSTDINLPPDNGFLELNIPRYSPHGRVSISGTLKFTGGQSRRGVWIYARDQNGNFGTTYVEKGQTEFRINNLVPGLYAVEVDTPGPRLRDKIFPNIKAPSEGLVFEIPVQEAKGRIRGIVIDKQTGEPVTDFNLLICGPGYAVQISDPNGQFDIEIAGHEPRPVQIIAEGFAAKTSDPITPDANEPIVIALGMPVAIEGTVVDKAGKPIPDVNISYRYARSRDESPDARYITTTDANGTFVVDDVPQDSTWRWFVIRHPDYAPVTKLIDVEEGLVTDVKIVLKEGGGVEGYVYDRQGKPMSDTTIYFMDESHYGYWQENRARLGAATTDSKGFYRIRHLPEKLCYAFKQESRKQRDPVTTAILPRDGQTLRLDIGGKWHATGRLLKDGQPFTYAEMAIMGNTAGYETAFKTYVTTDSQGRFTFYGIPTGRRYLCWPIPGLTGYRKWAELGRFYFQTGVDLDLGDFHVDLTEVTIELTGGDPAHPIEQWDVYVQKYKTRWLAPWGSKIGALLPRSEVTEPYTFSNIPLGKYEAVVNCQRYRLVHKVFELTQEQKHHKVSLHIPAGSAALQGKIRTPDEKQAQGDFTLRASDHNLTVFIKPEPDGAFKAENLPAGSYTLGRGHLRDSVLKQITVTDGGTTTVDVNLEDAEKDSDGYMVVLVVAEDGQPLAGADVRLEQAGRTIRPHSDSDMGKSLQGASGQYVLWAEYPGYKSVRQTVTMKSKHEFNTQQILDPLVVTMSKQ